LFTVIAFSCTKNSTEAYTTDQAFARKASPSAIPKGTIFYALTSDQKLVKYVSGNPLYETGVVSIAGLQMGEKILAIDFRPATGQLYAVSDMSRLYTINQQTSVALAVSMTPFTPTINGTQVGFDFNPTVDRIRLVTNTGQNLRLNPETGAVVFTDGSINPAGAAITAVAYTNNVSGASATTLYDIDVASDKLFIQNPPNNGTLVSVGSLGVQAVGEAGFDIAPDNSVAIAALYGRGYEAGQAEESSGNKYRFYYINLMTGEATNAGKTDRQITGIAIPTNPVAYAVDAWNNLLIFNPASPSPVTSKSIMGLQVGENILGIDMRPATGQLFALGSSSRLYAINMANGAATAIGAAPFSIPLSGTSFGFDFNPTVDRVRIVSNTGQNLRANPITGAVVTPADGSLNPGTPNVDGAAYTNSFAGSTMTTLYDLDYTTDKLYIQNPPNNGTLVEVGSLGADIMWGNGFDIGGMSNKAWAILTTGTGTGIYSINLITAAANKTADFSSGVKGFAVGLGF
jgi:hypothetical protein